MFQKSSLTTRGVLIDPHKALYTVSFIRTPQQPRPHGDVAVPVYGVEPHEPSRKRRIQVVVALHILVHITTKLLKTRKGMYI